MLEQRPSFATLAVVLALAVSLAHARPGPRQANRPEPFRVGVLLDLSGQTSLYGISARKGVELAADRLNAAGGVGGRPVRLSSHYAVEDPRPANRQFVAEYRGKYGAEPDGLAALGYDALGLLADAVRRAGTTEGARLRDALAETNSYAGVTGTIDLDAARDAVKPGVVFQLRDGKFVYQETIAPE